MRDFLDSLDDIQLASVWRLDLDCPDRPAPPPPKQRAQAFTLWLRSERFGERRANIEGLIRQVLAEGPFTTLQIVLEPTATEPAEVCRQLRPTLLRALFAVCQEAPTYLDKFYALQPGCAAGAKRLIILLPGEWRAALGAEWAEDVGELATLAWRGADAGAEEEMAAHEYAIS